MAEADVPVVRIVVDGCPAPKSITTNVPQARGVLLHAFESNRWPGKAMFAVTPGGFIVAPFPSPWKGGCGWASSADDFQALVKRAKKVVRDVLTPQVLSAARGRTQFLTLGVDLNDGSGKRKMDRRSRGTEPLKMVTTVTRPTYGHPAAGSFAISAAKARRASMSQTSRTPVTTPENTATLIAHTISSFGRFLVFRLIFIPSLPDVPWEPAPSCGALRGRSKWSPGLYSTGSAGRRPTSCSLPRPSLVPRSRVIAGAVPVCRHRRAKTRVPPFDRNGSESHVNHCRSAQYVVFRVEFNPKRLWCGHFRGPFPALSPVRSVYSYFV